MPGPNTYDTRCSKQTKNGGVLKLELGAVGVFKGTAEFIDNSIIATDIDPDSEEEQKHKGAAIHNKVCSVRTVVYVCMYVVCHV